MFQLSSNRNDRKTAIYVRISTGIISVRPGFDGFISGEYSFAEFDQMVREKGCYGYYSEYQFE